MKAFNELVSFADENGLKIWTKDIITELGDLVIVTELNRICATFHNCGIDDEKYIEGKKYPFILGYNNIYFVEYFILGQEIHTFSNSSEITIFLNNILISNKIKCELIDVNIDGWIKCWGLIYNLIVSNIDRNNAEQIFETELFNFSLNNSKESKLFNSRIKSVYLRLKHPIYKACTYTIDLFLDLNKEKDNNYFLSYNLKAQYSEGNNHYGYKFYYSKNYPQKYTYPSTPDDFINFFEINVKDFTQIDTLLFGD